MAKIRSHTSRSPAAKLSPPPAPALLNTRSTCPTACSLSSSSRNRSTCPSSATSQVCPVTWTPGEAAARARLTVSAIVSAFRSQAATEQPCSASCRVSSRPMPDPPPVTTASFSANDSIAITKIDIILIDACQAWRPLPWAGLATPEAKRARFADLASRLPGRRAGTAEDVARAIGYLIEDDFVTGTVLHAEGGQLLV